MLRPRTRWLSMAAATVFVGALLPASAALADTTPGAITGHVLDGTTPVANVMVDALIPGGGFAGGTTTDATGAFTISDVAPGGYIMQFSLPGGLTQYSHGKTSFETADLVTVTAGATTTDDEAVIPHGALGGTLTDSTGAPVPFAFVSVRDTTGQFFFNGQTDTAGHYLFPFVPPATYTVSFFANSLGFGQTAHNHSLSEPGDPFTVTVGATTTVDEQFVAPGIFSGRVTTADGLPAAGVEVFATGPGISLFAVTDANGQYSIKVFPGTYQLEFERGPGGLIQWAHGQTTQATAQSFTVGSGQNAVVDEQLLPTGTLAGHLNDSNGQPVPFGNVQISDGTQFLSAQVFNGDWHADVYPGTYTVAFNIFFGGPTGTQWATGKQSEATADHFAVHVGQTTRVDDALAAPGTVTLRVVDSVTGAPVQYCAQIGNASACSDSSGTATTPPILPGVFPVDVFPSDNHLRVRTTATVVSGQNTALDLVSAPGASITTTVRDSKTGAPLINICVNAVPTSEPSALNGVGGCADSTGTVTVTGLAAGSYNLFALSNDGVHGHQWVGPHGGTGLKQKAAVTTLATGQAVTVPDIKMDKAGTLTGIISDKVTGAGIAGAVAAWATSPAGEGGSRADAVADATGRYTFTELGPYDWPIFYRATGYASEWSGGTGNRLKSEPVTIKAGKTRTHNEALSSGVILTGLVTGPDGVPAPEFASRITVFNADSRDEIGANDNAANGTYTLHVLPSQSVVLNADLFLAGQEITFFYVNSPDFEHATSINIRNPGPIIVNIAAPPLG
jgi:Carboxypeptidase regulatory-like domain